jgi:hypothetical protein
MPFDNENTNILYKKVLKGEYSLPPTTPPVLRDFFKRVLHPNPHNRYNFE